MTTSVRVRYAPSPTGQPHIGNVRTALFNWLFARASGGSFIVRIEDTDQSRLDPSAVEGILESLNWLGIDWDEGPEVGGLYGPYLQSQRLHIYHEAAKELMEMDFAYHCYCTPQRLDEMRKLQMKERKTIGYDRHCLNLEPRELREYEGTGSTPVVRFKMPTSQEICLTDLVRGDVTWRSDLLDDFVILKSDGFPTYHLANVLDDHHMEISHVLRAEEWLSSTPRHLMLYKALKFKPPLFGHLPIILGPDRSKLSKRHGAAPTLEYKKHGYLPSALVNFMALLGWSLDDRTEIMDRQKLIDNFSLDRVVKAGAVFDREKLEWMNGVYIRGLRSGDLAEEILAYWREYPPATIPQHPNRQYFIKIMPLIQERLKTLDDAADISLIFFQSDIRYDSKNLVQKGMNSESSLSALSKVRDRLGRCSPFDTETLEEVLREMARDLALSGRQFLGLIRVAITGRTAAPPLFQTMEVLGYERCLERISRAIEFLKS